MANRTKSFFEQDHQNKPRPGQWHRPLHQRAPLADTAPNAALKAPIPANSQAKTKLKAFQFIAGRPDQIRPHGSAKENTLTTASGDASDPSGPETANREMPRISHSATRASQGSASCRTITPSLPHANTFPCTPGARLPLEDLIGNCDQVQDEEPTDDVPDEQIGWMPSSSSRLLTPNQRRVRKRARSSSPSCPGTSSQRHETPTLHGTKVSPIGVTPNADPAADLWRQYGGGKQIIEGLNLPDISNLIQPSPRQQLETPVQPGSFRRWASTGNDWPSSKNKRRCTVHRNHVNGRQDHAAYESIGKSKVAIMVQTIQETLASQRLEQEQNISPESKLDAPSSSSPLPETGSKSFDSAITISPLGMRQLDPPAPLPSQVERFLTPGQQPAKPRSNYRQHMPPITNAPLPAYKRPSVARPNDTKTIQMVQQHAGLAAHQPGNARFVEDLDEFEDDAFDLTADDLDELMPSNQRSLYDIPPHPDPPAQQQAPHRQSALTEQQQQQPRKQRAIEPIVLDDDDEFGCDDLDEVSIAQAEYAATQKQRTSPYKRSPRRRDDAYKSRRPSSASPLESTSRSPPAFQRFVVKEVIDGQYLNTAGRRCAEQLLLVEEEKSGKPIAVTLRDSWSNTRVRPGSTVHVASLYRSPGTPPPAPTAPGQIEITDEPGSPFIILDPDHMLSATTVADSFDCARKAVLQNRIKATSETNKPMVYGKILHEIFQQALSANQWGEEFLEELVNRTIQAHVEGLWELGMRDTNLAIEEVRQKMTGLASWAAVFVQNVPGESSLVDDRSGEKARLSISKLIAIEEHIWSPRFGLKGNIDVTVEASFMVGRNNNKSHYQKAILPFEVKTGRTTQSASHMAQTALYTLLLSDRYDVPVGSGVLYYLESSTMTRIAPPQRETRQMMQQRNRLAAHLQEARHPSSAAAGSGLEPFQESEESGLPKLLKDARKCSKCYARASCFTYHALVENGTAESAGMIDDGKKDFGLVWQETVGHLALTKNKDHGEKLKSWMLKWDRLLTFEESEQSRFRKELWTMSSHERADVGRCFGNLVMTKDLTEASASNVPSALIDGVEGSGGKINRFAYVFTRSHSSRESGLSFTEGSQLGVGEPVVVSSESGQWALANGYVIAVSRHEMTVAVDRRLGNARERLAGFHFETNQSFRGTTTIGAETDALLSLDAGPILYRLDKDEFSNGLALVRNNLVTLMSPHPMHTKLREQIILDSSPPSFTMPAAAPACSRAESMNEDQKNAVAKVLAANDYALILGMPGTGKTTTIAHIICALLAEEKTILLTSFTHTAVDNILLKIRETVPAGAILRLGVPAKINAHVQQFCQLAATPRKTIEEVEEAYMHTRIVATTCMGTNHAVFQRRTFDVCIVDEASQITLPTILGPLLKSRKFVLVGDHFQLPPLVQNRRALDGGLDVSLFRQLSESHPESVAALGRQYRMCEDIMSLSNALIYSGRLRCGNEAIAERTLSITNPSALAMFHDSSTICTQKNCWLDQIAAPANKVVFANTGRLGTRAQETLTAGAKNITNEAEATLAAQSVLALLAVGVRAADIGVITLYRSQLSLIKRLFKSAGISSEVEIDSADRFQGRDKECVILSMVRSNGAGIVGELLKDWRRVNVALTRARSKLVVLGDRKTLANNELLARLLALMDKNKWTVDLPHGADEMHLFDFSTQQVAASMALASGSSPSTDAVSAKAIKKKSNIPIDVKVRSDALLSGECDKRSPLGIRAQVKRTGSMTPKVINGKGSSQNRGLRKVKEQMVFEIFEDEF